MIYKINYFLNSLGLGGTEKTALLFARHLNREEFDVRVFTYADADMTRYHEFERLGYVGLIDRKNPNWTTLEDCDILHTFRSGYREAPSQGYEVIVSHFIETNIFGHFDADLRIDRSLFMSEWLMEDTRRRMSVTRQYIPEERWMFVNNPVESPYTTENMRDYLGLSDDVIVLGRCGRPDPNIYDPINVKAALRLQVQGYNVFMLSVAAPDNMLQDLMKYGIPHHDIAPTTDPCLLSRFYNTVDIYTHARADGETYGVNIAEAMIHGKPVVTHVAVPSFPGMGVFQSQTTLVRDKITGFVVQRDVGLYAEAVKKLIDNPELRATMGRAGKARALVECHAEPVTDKLSHIYRDVLNG